MTALKLANTAVHHVIANKIIVKNQGFNFTCYNVDSPSL